MIDLDLNAITWCPAHGHPALTYHEPTSDLGITIGVAADDAQLLAGHIAFLLIMAVRPEGLFPKVQT